jgi:hypothetical protein
MENDRLVMEKNLPVWKTKATNANHALTSASAKLQELIQVKEEAERKKHAEERKMSSQVLKNSDLSRLASEKTAMERELVETEVRIVFSCDDKI